MPLTFDQTPAVCNIRFLPGDDLIMPFQICEPVTTANGTTDEPIDVTGFVFEAQIRTRLLAVVGNVDIISPTHGSIAANFSESMTAQIPEGCCHWHLKMTDSTGYTRTIIHGNVEVGCNGGCE